MQDTPNFPNYLNRFQTINISTVLDGREKITGGSRVLLESTYDRIKIYFSETKFREQMTVQKKQVIEDNWLNQMLSVYETIAGWQNDGSTPINGPNLESQLNSFTDNLTAFDQNTIGYYYNHLTDTEPLTESVQEINRLKDAANQQANDFTVRIRTIEEDAAKEKAGFQNSLKELQQKTKDLAENNRVVAEQFVDNIKDAFENAKLLTGEASGNKLANYYQMMANGRTTDDNQKYLNTHGKSLNEFLSKIRIIPAIFILFVISVIIYVPLLSNLYFPVQLADWFKLLIYTLAAFLIASITLTASYYIIKFFNERYKGGHARTGALWMVGALTFALLTAIYSAYLVHELSAQRTITWEDILPKIIALLAPAYLVRLSIQNYRANAHLEVQYTHRATVVMIAESYSEATTIKDKQERSNPELLKLSTEARLNIVQEAAKIMFAQSESGYITQKEGAGSSGDNPMDVIRNNINLK